MVMAAPVKITKKAGNQEVSVDVFETYTTLETGQDVNVVEKDIVLISDDETPEQERQAWAATSLEGLDRWEEQHRQ